MADIQLERIVKDYGGLRAVHSVNLEVRDGEFVAFVGPSGCGKSTMLRMIAGLEEITDGILRIGGKVVNDVEPRGRDVAMVFQDYALYPHMTVAENIGFGLRMRGWNARDISARVKEVAGILQIEALLDRRPGEISGGQRQRVAMGRAVVREPTMFLFDEPLSNLDAKLRVEMRTQIKRLHKMLGTTTVYVTHDQTEAMTLADRVVVLHEGRIVQEADPIELYQRPNCLFVAEFIGSPKMNVFEAIVERSGGASYLQLGGTSIKIDETRLAARARVHVGIRPEHLQWCPAEEACLAPIVEVLEPLGSDTMAVCRLGEQELTARLDPEVSLHSNERINLKFDAANLHFFDWDSGNRVGTSRLLKNPVSTGI